jgi:lipopolysaccharide export LptBFGC system permease protein LptF
MSRPGDRLRAFAAHVCDERTMTLVIDPLIADMQQEHAGAARHGQAWRSRQIRLGALLAFLRVMVVMDWTRNETGLLMRTAGYSIGAVAIVTMFVVTPTVFNDLQPLRLTMYAVLNFLAIAIPVGLAVGIVSGLAGATLSARVRAGVMVLALAGASISFASAGWGAPLALRGARQAVAFVPNQVRDFDGTDLLSPAELTLGQLRSRIDAAARFGLSPDVGYLRFMLQIYYARWAVPAAPLTLTLALLAMASFPRAGRLTLGITAFSLILSYEVVGFAALYLNHQTTIPVSFAVWLPNLVLTLASVAMMLLSARRRPDRRVPAAS